MIGIDLISIKRIKNFIDKFENRALEKFLSKDEILLIKSPKTAAGFWATKEAISKAIGCGISAELSFFDITISKTPKGAPIAKLSQKAKDLHKIEDVKVSITHDGDFAIAIAYINFAK